MSARLPQGPAPPGTRAARGPDPERASDVAVVDYGAGNLRSVGGALDFLGARWRLARRPEELERAAAVILPGVGSAGSAMRELEARGLLAPLREAPVPLLGICLGLQLLFERSEEEGGVRGLALLPGTVRRLSAAPRLPHMGWNRVRPVREHPLLEGLRPEGEHFFFAHSFGCSSPADFAVAMTEHGEPFVSAAAAGSVWGVQFHPEKSAAAGLRVLSNFLWAAGLVDGSPAPGAPPGSRA